MPARKPTPRTPPATPKQATLTIVVSYDIAPDVFSDMDELLDRARERGEVISAKVTVPSSDFWLVAPRNA